MGELVNLRQARKQKVRADKETKAEANRLKFGRSKSEKLRIETEQRLADKHIEGHKRDE